MLKREHVDMGSFARRHAQRRIAKSVVVMNADDMQPEDDSFVRHEGRAASAALQASLSRGAWMRHREQFLADGGARISTGLQPSRSVSQYLRQQQVRQELTGRFFSKTGRERWQERALAVLVSGQARLPVDAPTARGDGASSSSSVLAETHAEALERPHLTTWLAERGELDAIGPALSKIKAQRMREEAAPKLPTGPLEAAPDDSTWISFRNRPSLDQQREEGRRQAIMASRYGSRDARLARFQERHGELASKTYQEQAAKIRKQLKDLEAGKRFVLRPGKYRALILWDAISTFALLYTAVVTPFEAAFISPTLGPVAWQDIWFLLNRALDVVFLLDMLLQFFLAYQGRDKIGGEVWIERHTDVVRNYLTSWFPLDASTIVIPAVFDFYLASPSFAAPTGGLADGAVTGSAGGRSQADSPSAGAEFTRKLQLQAGDTDVGIAADLQILRVLRVLRLMKLFRLVRASRVFERWKSKITLSYSTTILLQCVLNLLLGAHWYACLTALQASLHTSIQSTWLGPSMYAFCDEAEPGPAVVERQPPPGLPTDQGAESHGPVLAGCSSLQLGSWYLASFSWSVMVITGVGGTDYHPSAESDAETFVVTLQVVLGAFMWTRVLALFCDVAVNCSPALTHFRQTLDSINEFVGYNALPSDLAARMREYLNQQKRQMLRAHYSTAIDSLSPALKIEVVLHCNRHWLNEIWFLNDLEETCLVRLAMAMRPRVFSPNEVVPQRSLYVVQRGLVLYGGRVLSQGMPWGDDVLLTNKRYFVPFLARAMTYVDVQCLDRETLLEIVSRFPSSYRRIRKAAAKLALRRHLIEAARWVKNTGGDVDLALTGDFVDQVHEAAGTERERRLSRDERERERRSKSVNIAVQLDKDVRGGGEGGGGGGGGGIPMHVLKALAETQEAARGQLRAEMRSLEEFLIKLSLQSGVAAG